MDDEEIKQKLQHRINQLVEKKLDENEISGSRDEIVNEIARNLKKQTSPPKLVQNSRPERIDRRDFLKLLGMSAGTIGLISGAAGAWGQLRASSQGLSDVDADEVDGHHLSVGSSKPGSPATGTIFYDTDGEGVHYYNGSSWVKVTTSTSGKTIRVTWENGESFSSSSSGAFSVINNSSDAYGGSYLGKYTGTNDDAWVKPSDYPSYSLGDTHVQALLFTNRSNVNTGKVIFDATDGSLSQGVGVGYKDNNNPDGWELVNQDTGTVKDSNSLTSSSNTWYNIECTLNTDGSVDVTVYESGSQWFTLSTNDSIADGGGETMGFNYNDQSGEIWNDAKSA